MDDATRRTRRAFVGLGAGMAAGALGWKWLWDGPVEQELPARVRAVLDFNGRLAENGLYRASNLAPEFPATAVRKLRVNGDVGQAGAIPRSVAVTPYGSSLARVVSLEEIRALPRREQVSEFKCIEGWSTVTQWAGARFSDFVRAFAPESVRAGYVGLTTSDKEYFVGVDMASMLHPQTLLAWEQNGKPLEPGHGAPLRLVIPVKYGVKNIKWVASVNFSNQRPPDYWAQDGYDYYAGL